MGKGRRGKRDNIGGSITERQAISARTSRLAVLNQLTRFNHYIITSAWFSFPSVHAVHSVHNVK
jgi:hypothetical protein